MGIKVITFFSSCRKAEGQSVRCFFVPAFSALGAAWEIRERKKETDL